MQSSQKTKNIQKIRKCGKRMIPLIENKDVAKVYQAKLEKSIAKIKQIIERKQDVLDLTIKFLNQSLQRIPRNQYHYDQKRKTIGKFEKQIVLLQRHVQEIDNLLTRIRDNIKLQNQKAMMIEFDEQQFKQSALRLEEGEILIEDQQTIDTQKFGKIQYNLILKGLQNLSTLEIDLKSFIIAKIYHNNKQWSESIDKLKQIKQTNQLSIYRLLGINYLKKAKQNPQQCLLHANNAIKYLQKCVQKPWNQIKMCFSLLGEAYYLKKDIQNMEKYYLKEVQYRDLSLLNRDNHNKYEFETEIFTKIAKNAINLGQNNLGMEYYKKAKDSFSQFNLQKRLQIIQARIKNAKINHPQYSVQQQISDYRQMIAFIQKNKQNTNTEQICKLYYRLALLYAKNTQYNQAIISANSAMKYSNNQISREEYVNYAYYHYQLKKYGEAKKILLEGLKTDTLNKATYELLAKIKYDSVGEFQCVLFLKNQVDENLYTQWDLDILIRFHDNQGDSEEVERLNGLRKMMNF